MHTIQRSIRHHGVCRLLYPSLLSVVILLALSCGATVWTGLAAPLCPASFRHRILNSNDIVTTNINKVGFGQDIAIQPNGKILVGIINRIGEGKISSDKELVAAVGQANSISFTFTRVVDTNSPIPGGTGNFIFFTDPFTTSSLDSRPAVSIENGTIVFSGSGAFGQRGIYTAPVGGPITMIADTNTALPDGTATFRLFGTPSLSHRNVAFPASGTIASVAQGAFFVSLGSPIKTVADQNTPVPGGIGVFRGIDRVCLDDGNVAFVHSNVGKDRIFVADSGGQITLIADSTNFDVFNGLSFNDGIVAFISRQRSIFAAPVGSPPMLVVDVGSSLTGFNPPIDNGAIAFLMQGGNGIYTATIDGSISPVALVGTPIPSGTGNFTFFDADSPSHRDGIVAFRGFGPSGQEGIYASISGSLTKVIDLSNTLDGKTLTHLFLGYESVSGNQIAFAAQFANGSRGIYVAEVNEDQCPNSDLSATVIIGNCNSEVPNILFPSGCTISDLIGSCAEGAQDHGQFVSCVSQLANKLKKAGTITGRQAGAIQRCTAKAHIP